MYPKAIDILNDLEEWFEFYGKSYINMIMPFSYLKTFQLHCFCKQTKFQFFRLAFKSLKTGLWFIAALSYINSNKMLCFTGIKPQATCIFLPFYLCSLFLPPGVDFIRNILTMLISLLCIIIIKYVIFLKLWTNKILNGPPFANSVVFKNVRVEKLF